MLMVLLFLVLLSVLRNFANAMGEEDEDLEKLGCRGSLWRC